MTHTEYVEYFRMIAERNTDLAHGVDGRKSFFRMDVSEMLAEKMNSNGYIMLLERNDARLRNSSDNLQRSRIGAFIICAMLKKTSDYDGMDTIFATAEGIAEQVVLFMQQDFEQWKTDRVGNIIEFDLNTVEMMAVGPILENHYGIRCQFSFMPKLTNPLTIDPDKWL